MEKGVTGLSECHGAPPNGGGAQGGGGQCAGQEAPNAQVPPSLILSFPLDHSHEANCCRGLQRALQTATGSDGNAFSLARFLACAATSSRYNLADRADDEIGVLYMNVVP